METIFFAASILLLFLISIFLHEIKNEIKEFRRRVFFNNGVPVQVTGIIRDMNRPLYVQEMNPNSGRDIQKVHVTNMPDASHPMQCEIQTGFNGIDVHLTNHSIDIGQVYGVVETKKYVSDVL